MQDISDGDAFNEKESLSHNEKHQKPTHREAGNVFSKLDKGRKIAVIFLAFFSIFLFITWGVTTKNRINNPLNPKIETKSTEELSQNEGGILNTDSDEDGLSDQDEINLYNTSPYLEDTDSDGMSDYTEVSNGTDPNCREGENCSSTDVLQAEAQKTKELNNFINENINLEVSTGTQSTVINEGSLSEALKGESDVTTLRKMLLDAGMEEVILNTISDEDLLSSYQEILQ